MIKKYFPNSWQDKLEDLGFSELTSIQEGLLRDFLSKEARLG